MEKSRKLILIILFLSLVVFAGAFYWWQLKGGFCSFSDPYYNDLCKKCKDRCCKDSVKLMAKNNFKLLEAEKSCPPKFKLNNLRCLTSYKWCEPRSKDNIDWVIFRDEDYNFEFEYPKDFDNDKECRPRIINEEFVRLGSRINLLIKYFDGVDINDYIKSQLIFNPRYFKIIKTEKRQIGGEDAVLYYYASVENSENRGISAFFQINKLIFRIDYTLGSDCPVAVNEGISEEIVFQHILSTFKYDGDK